MSESKSSVLKYSASSSANSVSANGQHVKPHSVAIKFIMDNCLFPTVHHSASARKTSEEDALVLQINCGMLTNLYRLQWGKVTVMYTFYDAFQTQYASLRYIQSCFQKQKYLLVLYLVLQCICAYKKRMMNPHY